MGQRKLGLLTHRGYQGTWLWGALDHQNGTGEADNHAVRGVTGDLARQALALVIADNDQISADFPGRVDDGAIQRLADDDEGIAGNPLCLEQPEFTGHILLGLIALGFGGDA